MLNRDVPPGFRALLILDMNRLKRHILHGPLNPPTLGDFKHSIPPSIGGKGGAIIPLLSNAGFRISPKQLQKPLDKASDH